MENGRPQHLNSIQALRGIAAMLVLFFHIAEVQRQKILAFYTNKSMQTPFDEMALTKGIWDSGWAGVDLFFIISGFIMVYITQNFVLSLKNYRRFLWSRMVRIYPLWWFFALIMPVYFLFTYDMPAPPDRITSSDQAWNYLFKSLALMPQASAPVLGLGWSLIHEMHFYFMFSLLLLLKRDFLPWLLGAWALVIVIANMNGFVFYESKGWLSLGFSRLSLEFIIGALLAFMITQKRIYAPKTCLFLGGILAIIILFVSSIGQTANLSRVTLFAMPLSLIIYGAVGTELRYKSNVWQPLILLGNWSYSLYLCHYIVIVMMYRILDIVLPFMPAALKPILSVGRQGALDNIVNALLVIVLSVFIASLSYTYLERPILSRLKTKP